jgi:S1-C subfamily serine protease/Tfp pilus assembly protein PilF
MSKQIIPALLGISIAAPLMRVAPVSAIASSPTVNIIDRIVLIKTRTSQGSGAIVKHVGNTYTILTAAHVVNDLMESPVEITTPDRQQHLTSPSEVKIAPNSLDLATITFHSDREYLVAELGDTSTVTRGQQVFAAGFQGKLLKFHTGTVVAIGRQAQASGYSLAIGNADILPGMSGGGLFDREGRLIGINGKSIGTRDPKTSQTDRVASPQENRAKPVSGLAIPIDTFTQIASQLNVEIENKQSSVAVTPSPTADDFFITAGQKSQKGDYRGAINDYDRVLALNPQFEEVYFRRGIARSLLKDWQGAEADYTQAIAIKPGHAQAYLHRGSIRNTLNNWQGAKSDFDIAIALDPNVLSAYIGRGVARCELDDCQGGLNDYSRAIALNPNYADAYTRRGFAYHRLGNRRSAIDNYLAAAELYRLQGKDSEYLETVQQIKQLVRG